jgi:hypothetical protein
MTMLPSITDFPSQISRVNARRRAAGLLPLDQEQAVRNAIQFWNSLLREARERLREKTLRDLGRELADNSFTHLVLAREVAPAFQRYWLNLAEPE